MELRLELLLNKRVYLDSNIWIYALEGFEEYSAQIQYLFQLAENKQINLVTSELSLSEVLVKPIMLGKDELVSLYKEILCHSRLVELRPLSRIVMINTADIRAKVKIRLPDALHLASAIEGKCDFFLTNDCKLELFDNNFVMLLRSITQ